MKKRCTKCGEEKPIEDFHRQKGRSDGRREKCKWCRKEDSRAYYLAHSDRLIAYQKRLREDDREAYYSAKARRYANLSAERKKALYSKQRARIAADPAKNRKHQADYRERNAASIRRRGRGYVANLSDWYVRQVLFHDVSAPSRLPISQSLIDAKRAHLRITRHLRKEKP